MTQVALKAYDDTLSAAGRLAAVTADGDRFELDVARWLGQPTPADRSVVSRCVGPVLDVGCGPGRMVQAIAETGMPVLGLDIAPSAVQLTRYRGGPALRRSVFAQIPGERRWRTALLMDGNIGIGGAASTLLARLRGVLCTDGRLVVEPLVSDDTDEVLRVHLERDGAVVGSPFPWALVGLQALPATAASAGFYVAEEWWADERCFMLLIAR
jgi:hypothetical protein